MNPSARWHISLDLHSPVAGQEWYNCDEEDDLSPPVEDFPWRWQFP